jgi:putative salt-induced outer membrane protein YdiY
MKIVHTIAFLALFACAGSVGADRLYLQNGSVLIGTLVRAENDVVIFNTPFAGDIKVAKGNVERIITDQTVVLMMQDGKVYRDRRIDAGEKALVAIAEGKEPVALVSSDIKSINPESWKLGDGYKWSGTIRAAGEFERGNSDTDEWDIAAKTVWRSLKDRYTVDGDFERDLKDGSKTSDNWTVNGKYDRFNRRDPRNYWGGKVRFEYDQFADLDLRTTVGPHIGRQLVDTDALSLSGEIGPVWVDEQFNTAEDNDYPGVLWLLAATSDIIGFGTTLYLDHDGTFNAEDTDNLIVNTTVGLKIPLPLGFETGFEAKWEYDGGAVEDVDELDETYNLFVGYAW